MGEVGEDGAEFEPHAWRRRGLAGYVGVNEKESYGSMKAFSLSGRLISTWATKSSGYVRLKYL